MLATACFLRCFLLRYYYNIRHSCTLSRGGSNNILSLVALLLMEALKILSFAIFARHSFLRNLYGGSLRYSSPIIVIFPLLFNIDSSFKAAYPHLGLQAIYPSGVPTNPSSSFGAKYVISLVWLHFLLSFSSM